MKEGQNEAGRLLTYFLSKFKQNAVDPTSLQHFKSAVLHSDPQYPPSLSSSYPPPSSIPSGPRIPCISRSISPKQLTSTVSPGCFRTHRTWSRSAREARNPPISIDIAPTMSSAKSRRTKRWDFTRNERTAVRACEWGSKTVGETDGAWLGRISRSVGCQISWKEGRPLLMGEAMLIGGFSSMHHGNS